MKLVRLKISTAYLLLLQLVINFANPVPQSSGTRLKRLETPPLGPNIVLIHNLLRNETHLKQDYQTLSGIGISEPVITTSKEMPFLLQGGTFDDTNNFVNPTPQILDRILPTEKLAPHQQSSSSDSSVDLPLFYPSLPRHPQNRPINTHYGTIRETFNPHPGHKNLNSPRQSSFESFKPNLFGFPVISNTRENVAHHINW